MLEIVVGASIMVIGILVGVAIAQSTADRNNKKT